MSWKSECVLVVLTVSSFLKATFYRPTVPGFTVVMAGSTHTDLAAF